MTESQLCSPQPVQTKEELDTLLSDTGGRQYYEEMKSLPVDTAKLKESLDKTCKSRIRTWLRLCAHCGLCADSCFFYLTNNRDPKQVPAYKIQTTLGEIVRRDGQVSTDFMIRAMDYAWSKCTCCNRCGMYCPYGIDMGVMFSYLRGLLFSQGFVPWEMKVGSGMHRVYQAQMAVTDEEWVETCSWMCEEYEDDWPDLEIPVDKEDADILYLVNAREPMHYPDDIAEAAILFNIAGENWTVSSTGWDMTSLSMFAGDWEACTMQVNAVYEAMHRLRPKRMVGTECGHAFRATVTEGPYWAGRPDGQTPVPSIHYVEWVAEALRTGKLKIDPAKKIKEPVTLQDSCNYIRNHGLTMATREIMSYIAEDFREMAPNKEHNFCCGGGGGLNGIGRYRQERNIGLKCKLNQVLETGANLVVAPCHNCWDAIRDMEEEYQVGITWSFLKPLLLKMVEVPEHMQPKES